VLLNVSKLSYVDSSGLGVIVASFLAARSVGACTPSGQPIVAAAPVARDGEAADGRRGLQV
jgi:hypothetical protein